MPTPTVLSVAPAPTTVAPVAPAQPAAPNGAFSKALDNAAHQRSLKQRQDQDTADAEKSDTTSKSDANEKTVASGGSHELDSVQTDTAAQSLAHSSEDPCTAQTSDGPSTLLKLEDSETTHLVDPDTAIQTMGTDASAKADFDSVAHATTQGRSFPIGTGDDSSGHTSGSMPAAQNGPSANAARAGAPSSRPEHLSILMATAKRDAATNNPLPAQPDSAVPQVDGLELVRTLKPAAVTPLAVTKHPSAETSSVVAAESARAFDASTLDADALPILTAGAKGEVSSTLAFTPPSSSVPGAIQSTAGPGAASAAGPAATHQATIQASLESPGFGAALGAQLSVMARDGVQAARLHLNPAEMGPVTVQISLTGHAARVDMVAEQAFTRQMLEQSLPALASALRESGMTLTGGGVFEQHRPPQQPGEEARNTRPQSPGATTAGSGIADLPGGTVTQRHFSAERGVVDLYA